MGAVDVRVWPSPSGPARSAGGRPGTSRFSRPFATSTGARQRALRAGRDRRAAIAWSELRNGDWQAARVPLDEAQALVPALTHALPWCSVQALLGCARVPGAPRHGDGGFAPARAEAILVRRPALGVLVSQIETLREELHALREQDGRRESMLTPAEPGCSRS